MSETKINEISPQQAWDILESDQNAMLIDVRTTMEFEYVGHPPNAINIPWMEAPGWEIDADFVEKVRLAIHKKVGDEVSPEAVSILTLCRSGKRSEAAAQALAEQGFKKLNNIEDGFEGDLDNNKRRNLINGWRAADLPWEQS